jgi:hypothetical protein
MTPFCFGDGSVTACPCGNMGRAGGGCDNSGGTGGASLVATGRALLSSDTLTLTSSHELPTAASLFCQGDIETSPQAFGDGLSCLAGHRKRLYSHAAVGGAVSAPRAAEPSVSARSAAVGDPISPGAVRVYQVLYRDPDPNFCPTPAGAAFNVTNALRVIWGS